MTGETRGAASSRRRRSASACALALAAPAGLYLLTMGRTVYWGDGAELTAAAHCLGIAHPPGYPLYVWLGRLFLWLPFGEPALRMNLLSGAAAVLATGLWFGLSREIILLFRPRADPGAPSALAARAAWTAALGLSLAVWQHAAQTEVYALFGAANAGCLWLLFHAFRARSARAGLALAFVYGLAWQTHYLALLLGPSILALIFRSAWLRIRAWKKDGGPGRERRWKAMTLPALAALFFLVGVSGYLALPLRARTNPAMNWGDVSSPGRWVAHLTGGQFKQTKILSDPQSGNPLSGDALRSYLRQRFRQVVSWPGRQWLPDSLRNSKSADASGAILWLAAFAGLLVSAIRLPWLGVGLLGTMGLGVVVYLTYSIVDIEEYFIGLWPLALTLIFALLCAVPAGNRGVSWIVAGFGLAAGVAGAVNNYGACDLSGNREAAEYGERILEAAPADALLLTTGDSTTFTLWYYQVVEGRRPDLIVFDCNFVFQGWYLRYFENAKGVPLFAVDFPPKDISKYLVALGGGVIGPNIHERPILAAVNDDKLRQGYLIAYWRAQFVAPLFELTEFFPKVYATPPARALYRLHDNPEYREAQAEQFKDMFGQAAGAPDAR